MTSIPEPLRRLIGERADGRCEYCRLHRETPDIGGRVALLGYPICVQRQGYYRAFPLPGLLLRPG